MTRQTHPASTTRDDGFGLVELMVGLTVFAVLASALFMGLSSTMHLTQDNRHRSRAANVAELEMDRLRSMGVYEIPAGQSQYVKEVDGFEYTLTTDADWVAIDSEQASCDTDTSAQPQVLRITVEIDWPNRQIEPVRSETILTPPGGAYQPGKGHASVKVVGGADQPQGGLIVTMTPPSGSNQTLVTTGAGCAFFAQLDPGSYTFSLNKANWVDGQGNQNPSITAQIEEGNTNSVKFQYDRSASINVTIAAPDGGTIANFAPVTAWNTHLLPAQTKIFPGTGLSRTLSPLFPYDDGYRLWYGDCLQSDPGEENDDFIQTLLGKVTGTVLNIPSLDVHVQDASGDAVVAPVSVYRPDGTCLEGSDLPSIANTNSSGNRRIAIPYGPWEIRAEGRDPVTAWPTHELTPDDPVVGSVVVIVTEAA